MNRFLLFVILYGTAASAATTTDSSFTYKGACIVYTKIAGSPKSKTLANMDVELSKSAKVLYQSKGYSFEVEQIDSVYPDDGNRVEHSLNLRVMKNGQFVTWTMAEVGDSKDSGMILMSGNLPVISCMRAL